jgi:integrase
MPRRSKGPRLWLAPARRDASGAITHYPVWFIRDGGHKESTRCGESEVGPAQIALANYILAKTSAPRERGRDPSQCKIADVIAIYAEEVAPRHAAPKETASRLGFLLDYFGNQTLACLNAKTCDGYVKHRGKVQAARRELEDLRAAVRHHWKAGLCSALVPVVLPEKSLPRERWLTRDEAARLLWAAWRLCQGSPIQRWTGRHLARFILVGLYTGTRSGAICNAALGPTEGRGFLDVERGVFYRRPAGKRETRKRQPPIRIPPRLLCHLRRWARLGISRRYVVEWNGKPVQHVFGSWARAARAAGLGRDVTAHTLRHTCATWLMQAGADLWEVAGFLGMTVEMLQARYGHHHPDYQSGAVNALSGRRARKPEATNVVKMERRG